MELLPAFILFILVMGAALITGVTTIIPLAVGFVLFTLTARKRGYTLRQVLGFAGESLKESFLVIEILLLIGGLTGMWRLSGTVAYFVTLGISVIPPGLFLLAAFLLASFMSYALGTSFGVSATAGVILMTVARAGGINPVLAGGAILSGVYVGDRGSPAASSGNLVAVLTGTDMRKNVREMLKCSLVPFFACCALYGVLSVFDPMEVGDTEVLNLLSAEFRQSWVCLLPAVLMIALPFAGVGIKLSMVLSLISAAAVAVTVQGAGLADCLKAALLGFSPVSRELTEMLSGGGMASMLEVSIILILSCSYGTVFKGTGLLDGVNRAVAGLAEKLGRFPVMVLLSYAVSAVFCNQTVGGIMQSNLSAELYGSSEEEKTRKMLDMENSVILLAGTVPWCIAASVPIETMGCGSGAIPFAFDLWLMPLWWYLKTRREDRKKA